ncbi:MAG TPA: hypothetical protein VLJ15_08230 [Gammaproteobacteria bacterium]|nr:hypothetical protein [Gammaproteobacteria bacterium]
MFRVNRIVDRIVVESKEFDDLSEAEKYAEQESLSQAHRQDIYSVEQQDDIGEYMILKEYVAGQGGIKYG